VLLGQHAWWKLPRQAVERGLELVVGVLDGAGAGRPLVNVRKAVAVIFRASSTPLVSASTTKL